MSAYTVSRGTLLRVFLSGYSSGISTAATQRDQLAQLAGLDTDDDMVDLGREFARRLESDPAGIDAVWRTVLACMSGVSCPVTVIEH